MVDYKVSIAHNKVMILDLENVVTGSFNFTKGAQKRNAENVIVIHDAGLAQKYYDNWNARQKVSRGFS